MIFTPESWTTFVVCIVTGHEWGERYHVDHQERKQCGKCGIERKTAYPLTP